MLDNNGYRYTFKMSNTYCFSTATMVLHKYLNVKFIRTLPVLMPVLLCTSTQNVLTVTNDLLSLDTASALSLKSVCWYSVKVWKKETQTHQQKYNVSKEQLHKTLFSCMCNGKQKQTWKRWVSVCLSQAPTLLCSNIYCCSKLLVGLHGNVCTNRIYTIV
jgi:hypothetical protein